jgi:hypothetical protein
MGTEDMNFEKQLNSVLKQYGYLFPETDSQMAVLEKNLENIPLPEEFESPDFVFIGNRKTFKTTKISIDNTEGENNWAIAARDGKEISKEMWEEMKKDEEEAKQQQNAINQFS